MSKVSRRGIVYDLTKSDYRVTRCYDGEVVIYVFSSLTYEKKFVERLEENRKRINESLSNRFGYKIENDMLCDFVLYNKIEKRGFLILVNGVSVKCQEHITLDGKNPIIRI